MSGAPAARAPDAASGTAAGAEPRVGGGLADGRWRPAEIAFWLLPVPCFFLFPGYLVLGAQVFADAAAAILQVE